MSADRWAMVSRLTADAMEVPAAERAAWLAHACGADDALRREVEALLAADAQLGAFLAEPALRDANAVRALAEVPPAALAANQRIGAYRLVRELGHGGMGVVHLAARADEAFDRLVAVKVVRAVWSSDIDARRFRDERRILASLDHPNIARLLDGGTTDDGLPYLVMEYVDGVTIDAYCREQLPTVAQRLRLFQHVCEAVQYAHQRLVIHRDIKPRNILVTSDGTPKLLDFGIARLMDEDGADARTQTALRAYTLEYASPEQIRGEPMSTASDVYSLGVLLFELVTDVRPYGAATADVPLIRAICEDPPTRPSLAARGGSGLGVNAELESIILTALRKEPERRFSSAQALSDDIGRLLNGQPVSSAPDSVGYRARKFVSRHRVAVAAGVLLTASMAAGIVATMWQARRADAQRALAEERLQSTRRLANAMVFEVNDALEAGGTGARALLLRRASEQLDALAAGAPDDPVLSDELATAYHRLGDLLGQTGAAHVGNRAEGLANHRKGLAIRQALVARRRDDVQARARLVQSLMDTTYAEDEVEPSFQHARRAVEIAEGLAAAQPADLQTTRLLADAYYMLGTQYRTIGDSARSFQQFERATPLFQRVYDAAPDAGIRRSLALCHKRLAAILGERGEHVQALVHLRQAVALDAVSVDESSSGSVQLRDLSTSNVELGVGLINSGDVDGAIAAYRRAQAIRQRLFDADHSNRQASRDLASVLRYLAVAENTRRQHDAALTLLGQADGLAGPVLYNGDDFPAEIAEAFGNAYEGLGRMSEALASRRRALARRQEFLRRQTGNLKLRARVVSDALAIAATLRTMSDRSPSQRRTLLADACATLGEVRGIDLSSGEQGAASAAALRDALARCHAS